MTPEFYDRTALKRRELAQNQDLILCPYCREAGIMTWVNRKRMARHVKKHMRAGYPERNVGKLPPRSRSQPQKNKIKLGVA